MLFKDQKVQLSEAMTGDLSLSDFFSNQTALCNQIGPYNAVSLSQIKL